AMVTANIAIGELGWGNLEKTDQDMKEKWALERLSDALMEKGGLVPLSKKKRELPTDAFLPPTSATEIWSPLLQEIRKLHPIFFAVLSDRIIVHLLTDAPREASFDASIARWAMWLVDSDDADLRKDLAITLIVGIGPDRAHNCVSASALLQALCGDNTDMEAALSLLRPVPGVVSSSVWTPEDINVMHERLVSLLAASEDDQSPDTPFLSEAEGFVAAEQLPAGWRLLDSKWTVCPIGIYHSV
ncbi:unnamed protein product, partial [Mycena citricolor]